MYRLDADFPQVEWGQPCNIPFEDLKSSVHNSLQTIQAALEESEDGDPNVNNIYMSLLDMEPSAPQYYQPSPLTQAPFQITLDLVELMMPAPMLI